MGRVELNMSGARGAVNESVRRWAWKKQCHKGWHGVTATNCCRRRMRVYSRLLRARGGAPASWRRSRHALLVLGQQLLVQYLLAAHCAETFLVAASRPLDEQGESQKARGRQAAAERRRQPYDQQARHGMSS